LKGKVNVENKKTLCWLSLGTGIGLVAGSFLFFAGRRAKRDKGRRVGELLDDAARLLARLRKPPRTRKMHQG
jgi:hypothetical protein